MSTIRVDNFGPSAGGTTFSTVGITKAWASFSMAGTQSMRDSNNISSITDGGTGISTFAITSAFANANWAHVACSGEFSGGGNRSVGLAGANGPVTASSITFRNFLFNSSSNDDDGIAFALLGDLA
jgi:hypothetical protein